MCLLTNERYKIYQTGFSFGRLGHAPGVRLGGTVGVEWSKKKIPKFNQIWCVSYLHQWHMQRHNYFGPHPLGPWGGAKRSNIIKSQSQSQFLRFVNQTLCVFSQMQDVKHIRRYFHSVARSCLRGGTSFFSPNSIRFGVCVTHMNGTCNGTILLVLGLWEGPKGQILFNLNFKVNFKDF